LPDSEREIMAAGALEHKRMALEPELPFANLRSLAYLEDAFFTYWNEASGPHVELFWQRVEALGLPFQRRDAVREVLRRGSINNAIEHQAITDALVIRQQIGTLSPAEAKRLSKMLGAFEARAAARRRP
jgi:hypothetical protein